MSFNKFLGAIRNGDFTTLKIEYNPDFLNEKDENGYSAIQLAVMNKNLDMIKLLIRLGCDLDCKTENNQTLVDLANQTDNKEIREKIEHVIKNIKIAKLMKLTCYDNCDHNFCLISFCFNEFKNEEFVNKGRFGKITKVQVSNSQQIFAIKRISWKPIQNDDGTLNKEALYLENNINNFNLKLKHKRIVTYYGAYQIGPKIFIFMDYISGGSLEYIIANNPNDELPVNKIWKYTQQILEGLEFLHEQDIIHRDVKPCNILLDEDDNCKLTDLGFSRLLRTIERFTNNEKKRGATLQANTACGTSNYMTPEMIMGLQYRTECDIWSLGATVFHMYFGKPPFYGEKQNEVFMKIGRGQKPPYLERKNKDEKIISLIEDMFIVDQKTRPTAKNLLKNYF